MNKLILFTGILSNRTLSIQEDIDGEGNHLSALKDFQGIIKQYGVEKIDILPSFDLQSFSIRFTR
jgi:hypothetical protein